MKWKRLYIEDNKEEGGGVQTIPVQATTRELKLIQGYLRSGKPLNDPSNKESMEAVVKVLNDLVGNSELEKLDLYVSNWFHENLGIEIDLDPYGGSSVVELGNNGLVPLANCSIQSLSEEGEYRDLVQGGFWNSATGELEEGFMDVDDMNLVLAELDIGNGIDSIQLKKDGKVAKVLLTFT